MIAIKAHFDGKYLVPDEPVELPEGKTLCVRIEVSDAEDADPLYHLTELAERTGVPDLALNIDHYLYGHPKVRNAAK